MKAKTNDTTDLDKKGDAPGVATNPPIETIASPVTDNKPPEVAPITPQTPPIPITASGVETGKTATEKMLETGAAMEGATVLQFPQTPEKVTAGDLLTDMNETAEAGEDKDDWKCPGCEKSFEYRSFLVRHINKGHKGDQALMAQVPPSKRRATNPQRPPFNPDAATDLLASQIVSDAPIDYEFMSNVLFDTTTGTCVMIFGDEWKPRNDDERKMMIMGIGNYLKVKQIKDIPPGLMLTMLAMAYAAPRLRAPSTSQKLQGAWMWVKSTASKLFKRKAA